MAALNREFLVQLNLFILFAIRRQQRKRKKTSLLGQINFSEARRAWCVTQTSPRTSSACTTAIGNTSSGSYFYLSSYVSSEQSITPSVSAILNWEQAPLWELESCRFLSFYVVEIGFVLSQRQCSFLFLSVVIDLSRLLQSRRMTGNDSQRPCGNQAIGPYAEIGSKYPKNNKNDILEIVNIVFSIGALATPVHCMCFIRPCG